MSWFQILKGSMSIPQLSVKWLGWIRYISIFAAENRWNSSCTLVEIHTFGQAPLPPPILVKSHNSRLCRHILPGDTHFFAGYTGYIHVYTHTHMYIFSICCWLHSHLLHISIPLSLINIFVGYINDIHIFGEHPHQLSLSLGLNNSALRILQSINKDIEVSSVMGVPHFSILFRLGFSTINQPANQLTSYWGTPIMETILECQRRSCTPYRRCSTRFSIRLDLWHPSACAATVSPGSPGTR